MLTNGVGVIVQENPIYYRILGKGGFNKNAKNFWGVIKLIGKHHGASNNNAFKVGISVLKDSLNWTGRNISRSEIVNLISSKFWCTKIENEEESHFTVYRVSNRSDQILRKLFQILVKIEIEKNQSLNNFFNGEPEKDYFWREFVIHDCDDKLQLLLDNCPSKRYRNLEVMVNNISRLNESC